jgi:hypothetical protein
MAAPKFIPTPVEISRETLTVLAGAIVAAFIIGQLPGVRRWIRAQWGSATT